MIETYCSKCHNIDGARCHCNPKDHLTLAEEAIVAIGIDGFVGEGWPAGAVEIRLHSESVVTLDMLRSLSEWLGTRRINIRYDAETPDYSDLTPGDPSRCSIMVEWAP